MGGHILIPFRTIKKSKREIYGVQYSICTAVFKTSSGDMLDLPLDDGGLSTENSYSIGLEEREWNPDTCECSFNQQLILNAHALKNLFEGDYSIADKKAVLGIAAVWSISKSKISGCDVLPLDITYEFLDSQIENDFTVPLDLPFGAGMLFGKLTVNYKLYLKKAPARKAAKGTATVSGTMLGDLTDPLVIEIDGEGSCFPIVTVEQPDMPLWWIDSDNLEDPLTDPMDQDFFCLVINKKHRDYSKLYAKKGLVIDTPLYREIFSAGLEEMFRRLYLSKDVIADKMKNADQGDEGSIALCFDFIRRTMEIEVDTPEHLHISIRKAVERKMKGAAS